MDLVEAAAKGDHITVAAQLAQGIDVNSKDTDGRTALSWAVEGDDLTTIELLLAHRNIDVNSRDIKGQTPVLRAIRRESKAEDISELLLQRADVDLDLTDHDGRTLLSWAAGLGYEEVVLLLMKAKVSSNSEDRDGRTPLSWAAGNGHRSTTRVFFLVTDEMKNLQDKNGRTPLSWAAGNGHYLVVKDLCRERGVRNNLADFCNRTPISWAAGNGHDKVVQEMLSFRDSKRGQHGGRIVAGSRDSHGRTPLSWAAGNGCDDVVAILIETYRVDINGIDQNGQNPLLQAVKHGHGAVVRRLLSHNSIKLNIVDALGQTALHYAVKSDYSVILRDLLAHRGLSVDARDMGSITPLGRAVQHKATQSIHCLLQSSASTEGITRNDWIDAFNELSSNIVLLSEVSSGAKSIRFIAEECLTTALSSSAQTRHLILCGDFSLWGRQLIPNSIRRQDREVSWRTEHTTGANAFTWFVAQVPGIRESREYLELEWCPCVISWDLSPQSIGTVSLNYFSMLPYSAFPKSAATLFEQLLCHLRQRWLEVCTECELYLADQRRYQLQEKGESVRLIHNLARDAQVWSSMRYHLRDHVSNMQEFNKSYLRFNIGDYNEAQILGSIAEFEAVVEERVKSLDQALRDLLQFEFAWVSINEAHRSIDLAASMKRLTWITFIFLPLMFSSSLFGMNVDLLKDNPDWRWYALFASVSLALTTCGWLIIRSDILKIMPKRLSSYKLPKVESKISLPR